MTWIRNLEKKIADLGIQKFTIRDLNIYLILIPI